jgi:hypothetical protein
MKHCAHRFALRHRSEIVQGPKAKEDGNTMSKTVRFHMADPDA